MEKTKKRFLFLQIFAEGDDSGDKIGISADAGRSAEDRSDIGERFEQLIKGEYADEFARRTQKIIDKRFRETRTLEDKNRSHEEFERKIADLLGEEDPDRDAMLGKLERALVREKPEDISVQSAEASLAYPGFDYARESADGRFSRYISLGLTCFEAYTLVHRDELLTNAARSGALDAVRSIGSMGSRAPQISDGGGSRQSRRSVGSLSSSEIRSLVERASRGERIDFSDIWLG